MPISLSLTESQIFTALRTFLLGILPGVEVVRGLDNRVAEPAGIDFVVMTPLLRERLSWNVSSYADVQFTASIANNALTVSAVQFGTIAINSQIFGTNVADNTVIQSQSSGTPGGIGVYLVTPIGQTVLGETMASGADSLLQPVKFTAQIDVHGPNSANNAQIITTMFRDDYGIQAFAASGFDVTPLHCGEPKQLPFSNAEQQIEERWSLDALMQINPVVTYPKQFANALAITVNPVL